MKIAVKDANVFIDLELMGVLDAWFQLEYATLTSTLITDELKKGKHHGVLAYVKSGQIREINLELSQIWPMFEEYEDSGTTLEDISVLYLALENEALLLTGDSTLRIHSEAQQVETHGTIWIMNELVEKGILRGVVAAEKLESLVALDGEQKRFLPQKVASEYIRRWRK